MKWLFICISILLFSAPKSWGANSLCIFEFTIDTIPLSDSTQVKPIKPKHNPRLATKRSAIIPGWGQAYNKEYWKIPLVYGALSIPVITFVYNNTWYNRTRFAYDAKFDASRPVNPDSSRLGQIHPDLRNADLASLLNFRNIFRRDRDYSVLWFLVVWGLNVVDATVFGHLKEFDVTDELSMKVTPQYLPQTRQAGIQLNFQLKHPEKKIYQVK